MRSALALALTAFAAGIYAQSWMPKQPGPAHAALRQKAAELGNAAMHLKVTFATGGSSDDFVISNNWSGAAVQVPGYQFSVALPEGRSVSLSPTDRLHLTATVTGKAFERNWQGPGLRATWAMELPNGANYIRLRLTLTASQMDLGPAKITLLKVPSWGSVTGTTPGSPVTEKDFFYGVESPMSKSSADGKVARCWIERKLPLKAGQSVTYSAVIGVAPAGQMRRAFLNYLERERPRQYKPFLHYNSWYDLGYFNRYSEAECLQRIQEIGEELSVKRNVKLSSFLFDDGWDNPNTVWQFTKAFSNGFVPMKQAAAKYGAAPGAWLSPWGGYGTPRKERLAAGAKAGMEIDAQGYALSGLKYYDLFHKVTLDMVARQGINQFKFDGTGSPDKQFPGSKFDSDFDAAIQLIQDLRAAKPGLFVNLTTGTWPSPFWTRYADSIWRGGSDHSFAGVGPDRERWITYRDGDTYHGVVLKGPLYPLNSLMLHGLIYAQHADKLSTDPTGAFRHEVRSYFGSGTQLQEMYITPSLLSKQNWDDIAECARWSQANADVLKDTHWVGGDPLKGEVYGWAAWSPRKAILTLRNPSDKPQEFLIEPKPIFETPANFYQTWNLIDRDSPSSKVTIRRGGAKVLTLGAFEVRTFTCQVAKEASLISPEERFLPPMELPAATTPSSGADRRIAVVGIGDGSLVVSKHSGYLRTYRSPPGGLKELDELSRWGPTHVVLQFGHMAQPSEEARAHDFRLYIDLIRLACPKAQVLVAISGDGPATSLLKQIAAEDGAQVLSLEGDPQEALQYLIADLRQSEHLDKKAWRLVATDSEQPDEGPAKNAIDGDPNTYWHTRYDPKLDPYPHELVIDLGSTQKIVGFRYLPRQDGGVNGRVKGYRFFISRQDRPFFETGHVTPAFLQDREQRRREWRAPDGGTWQLVAEGEFPNVLEAIRVRVESPVIGRYVKFIALSEQNGQPYASAAEIDIIRSQ